MLNAFFLSICENIIVDFVIMFIFMKTLFIIVLYIIFLPFYGNSNTYKFRTVSPKGGFYYDGVKKITQDKSGFIWVMMYYELYRFDGYQYKKYYQLFKDISPDKKWIFWDIAADKLGYLYVNTSNGLFKFNTITEEIEKLYDKVSAIKIDSNNNLWIKINDSWSYVKDNEIYSVSFPWYTVKERKMDLCFGSKATYIYLAEKVYEFDYDSNSFNLLFAIKRELGNISFAEIRNHNMWMYTEKGKIIKKNLKTADTCDYVLCDSLYDLKGTLRSFYVDPMEQIWLGTINGLYIWNSRNNKLSFFQYSNKDIYSIPNNSIWDIYEDKNSNIWIGMYSGKLCYVNIYEHNNFKTWTMQNSGLNNVPISSFAEDDNCLFIGTEGAGIYVMNKTTLKITSFNNKHSNDNIKSLLIDTNKNIWAATYKMGLQVFDYKGRELFSYKHVCGNTNSLYSNDVKSILHDENNGIWISYQYSKPVISHYSFCDKIFRHYVLDEECECIFDIYKQGDKYLWAITNNTLYCFNLEDKKVKKYRPSDTFMNFFSLCIDNTGNIWLGTMGNGLIKFDINFSRFIHIDDITQNKITNIYSICYEEDCLWIGTDNGLYKYNMLNNDVKRFTENENTQGQVYYPWAKFKSQDKKMYFGGTTGFTAIESFDIHTNNYLPKVMISQFFIDNTPVNKFSINSRDSIYEIELKYNQKNFGFQISSDNYYLSQKNLYKYRLKGYSNDWNIINSNNRTIMYSQVPPGEYLFEVYAANNDGLWSIKPTMVRIIRRPAPWANTFAYFVYAIIFVILIYFISKHITEKRKLKLQLYHESVEQEKREEIHRAQLQFFTNISHDFRTPLTLMLASLDRLHQEGLKDYYYNILNNNARQLLGLVNELMDFRRIENGMMKLNIQKININDLVKNTSSNFTDYAKQHNITFQISFDNLLSSPVLADKNVIEKIIMNILNNAFKYTQDNSIICIKTLKNKNNFHSQYNNYYSIGDQCCNSFSIIVSDNGIGIPAESIGHIFERYYKVETTQTNHIGTGIGLALVKKLVLLHGGNISIYSEIGKGTDIIVSIPFTVDYFENVNEFLETTEEVDNNTTVDSLDSYSELNKKKILIVEDNVDLQKIIVDFLSDEFQVISCGNGIEALSLIEKSDFDIIVSDIMMPQKDGISLCNDIKSNIKTSHIPVVLLTAKTDIESKIEGSRTGADLYLEKPINLYYLKSLITNLFRNRTNIKEHYAKCYYADSNKMCTEEDSKFLGQLIEFIDVNMGDSNLDVNNIARHLGMSKSKLYIKIKALTGKSIVEFVLNYRIKKAARLLIETNQTIREIMLQVGIESPAYFTNTFKKLLGETPSSFISKYRSKENVKK